MLSPLSKLARAQMPFLEHQQGGSWKPSILTAQPQGRPSITSRMAPAFVYSTIQAVAEGAPDHGHEALLGHCSPLPPPRGPGGQESKLMGQKPLGSKGGKEVAISVPYFHTTQIQLQFPGLPGSWKSHLPAAGNVRGPLSTCPGVQTPLQEPISQHTLFSILQPSPAT